MAIEVEDAKLLLETVTDLEENLKDAKVPASNPERVKFSILKDKLQDIIDSPQIDEFTVEETKQLRVLLIGVMAKVRNIEIDVSDLIDKVNKSPDAYRIEIEPNKDGNKVSINFTGTATN